MTTPSAPSAETIAEVLLLLVAHARTYGLRQRSLAKSLTCGLVDAFVFLHALATVACVCCRLAQRLTLRCVHTRETDAFCLYAGVVDARVLQIAFRADRLAFRRRAKDFLAVRAVLEAVVA